MAQETERGLYNKFRVERTDGQSQPGEKHHRCEYFVLDLNHDPFAVPALIAYAQACQSTYPLLSYELGLKINVLCEGEWTHDPPTERGWYWYRLRRPRQTDWKLTGARFIGDPETECVNRCLQWWTVPIASTPESLAEGSTKEEGGKGGIK